MTRTMKALLALLVPTSMAYAVGLWWFRTALFQLFYKGKYREYSGVPILLVGAIPIAVGAIMVLGAGLRALERPDSVFFAYMAASLSTLCVGLPLSHTLGVAGAAAGILVSSSVAALSLAWSYYRRVQDSVADARIASESKRPIGDPHELPRGGSEQLACKSPVDELLAAGLAHLWDRHRGG